MELVVAPIVSVAVEETGRSLCCSIYSTIKNIVRGPQQLDLLESNMNSLMALRNDAEEEMRSAERDRKVIKEQTIVWVGEVDKLQRKYDQIQDANSSRSFLSCITKRYRISTKVAEHLGEIKRLREEGRSLAGSVALSFNPEIRAVEHIPGPSIKYQTASVSEDLAKVIPLLSEDKKGIIGIWGIGGVGKTNLVRNLNNKLLEINSNMPFSCVLWVTVSKHLDIKKLQKDIAGRLCLKMEESSGADGMAAKLHRRLKEERFLLILDDVWEKIDLDKLGVPRPEDHIDI